MWSKASIDLIPGEDLPNKSPYRCNPMETKELQKQISELMSIGYVRESMSPCAVPKKDGTWRICALIVGLLITKLSSIGST